MLTKYYKNDSVNITKGKRKRNWCRSRLTGVTNRVPRRTSPTKRLGAFPYSRVGWEKWVGPPPLGDTDSPTTSSTANDVTGPGSLLRVPLTSQRRLQPVH